MLRAGYRHQGGRGVFNRGQGFEGLQQITLPRRSFKSLIQPADVASAFSALSLLCGYSQRHLTAFQFGCSPTHWAIYGGAPMAHCCSEPFHENTRCFSSQVAGDSTAHTVTIRSTRFMPDIPESSKWIARRETKPAARSFK